MPDSFPPAVAWARRFYALHAPDLETERRQARDEGRDVSAVEAEFDRLIAVADTGREEAWMRDAATLLDRVAALPFVPGFPHDEPDDLAAIRAARPAPVPLPAWKGDDAARLDRVHGALLGRMAGCLLGKPVELWDRASIRLTAGAQNNWPLTDYLRRPTAGETAQIDAQSPRHRITADKPPADWLREKIDGMVEDDDINYTVAGFAIVKKYGVDFAPEDVAEFWCRELPLLHLYTAERVAYRNFLVGVPPPRSASYRNPHREWIGAQIRADFFGYANPGDPERAAGWAWRDACISHVRNGIYGEMWVAAMLAAAFVERDWPTIIRAGLAQIPARCRLAEDIEKMLALHAAGRSHEEMEAAIHAQWDEYNAHDWCHTIPNAQVVALGLLCGGDDYELTVSRAVMAGFDTDCNGATCGSLWGIVHGAGAVPGKWTAPLRDRVRTGLSGYHEVSIRALAEEMAQTGR